jgi:hypothetical protein
MTLRKWNTGSNNIVTTDGIRWSEGSIDWNRVKLFMITGNSRYFSLRKAGGGAYFIIELDILQVREMDMKHTN